MSTLERIQYGFDRDSRRTWKRRALTTNEDDHYGYDGLNQVINAARGNLNLNTTAISGRPANEELWNYDPTGNWQGYNVAANGAPVLDQSRVHDRGNRLTQIEDNPNAMIVDRAGRMRQMSPDAGGDWNGKLELTWDAWSRIASVKNNGTVVGTYEYDGLTRRTTRTVSSVKTHTYYNDVWRPLEERKNTLTTASAHYLWGARHRDDLVRRDRVTSGTVFNETRYVLMDYFSPAAITDEEGEVTERYAFSAFGVRRILDPDFNPRSESECGFEFAFQGQFLDQESGLMNYGFRYYTPRLGQWLCKDPIGELGGINLYAIVDNGVTNAVDFFGLAADCDCKNGLAKVRDDYGKKCCIENRAKDKHGREKCDDKDKDPKEKKQSGATSSCCAFANLLTAKTANDGLFATSMALSSNAAGGYGSKNSTDGFREGLINNRQGTGVYRHILLQAAGQMNFVSGVIANYQARSNITQAMNAPSYARQMEGLTEMQDDEAGREVGRILRDLANDKISQEEAARSIGSKLCDPPCL